MKKPLLITIGVVLVLLVLGTWVYLIMFGSPKSTGDVFSDFGFDIVAQPTNPDPPEPAGNEPVTEIINSSSALQQLTTRTVAGFVILEDGNTSKVRFAEVGTGHIYDITLATRAETRVSGTTIPQVVEAVFSSNGDKVALTQISGASRETFIGELTVTNGQTALEGDHLISNARNIHLDEDTTFYTVSNFTTGTEGYQYTDNITAQTRLFTVPLSNITMLWQPSSPHFFYNKPTAGLFGTVFQLQGSSFVAKVPDALGRAAIIAPNHYALTYIQNGQLLAESVERKTNQKRQLAVATIPEKCALDQINAAVLWCAAPIELLPANYLEVWYQGALASDDVLWELQLDSGEAILEVDFETVSGRPIDVTNLASDSVTNTLMFINKLDRTLWMYDLLAQ